MIIPQQGSERVEKKRKRFWADFIALQQVLIKAFDDIDHDTVRYVCRGCLVPFNVIYNPYDLKHGRCDDFFGICDGIAGIANHSFTIVLKAIILLSKDSTFIISESPGLPVTASASMVIDTKTAILN